MKKLIIIFFLIITANIFSQYSLPLRLVNGSGDPLTGQSANISFTRYPHSYPTDAVSGITITEVGTAGNYICKGFTTYEYVKLWISGVAQSWFDSVQVGSVTSNLSSNYLTKTTTQTGISGTKTLTGDWLWTSGTITMNKPYIYTSSTWYTDYSLLGNSSLGWKGLNDSLYVLRSWMFLSGSKITLQSGYKIWGLANTQPFQINTTYFTWSTTDGLGLVNPLTYDSVTIRKDTTISENPYYKTWSAKRRFWSQTDSLNLYWYYKNTYMNTADSFAVINNKYDIEDNHTYARTVDSITVTPIDTFSLPGIGYWDVTVHFEYEFEYVTPNNTGYDSLYVGIYYSSPNDIDYRVDYSTYKVAFNSGVPFGFRNRGDMTFTYKITTAGNEPFYLSAVTSGACHTAGGSAKVWIRRNKVEALRVR